MVTVLTLYVHWKQFSYSYLIHLINEDDLVLVVLVLSAGIKEHIGKEATLGAVTVAAILSFKFTITGILGQVKRL